MKVIKQSAHIVTDWPKMNLYERCEFAGRISHASEDKIKEGSAEEFVRRMVEKKHESVFEFARVKFFESHAGVNVRTLREKFKSCVGTPRHPYRDALILSIIYPAFFADVLVDNPQWGRKIIENASVPEADNRWIPVLITTNRAISHQLVRYRKNVVYLQSSQRYIKYSDVEFISPDVYFDLDDKMYRQWIESMERAEQDYFHALSEGYSAQAARLFLPNSTATKLIMYASPDTWRHVFEQRISAQADPMIRELLEPLKEEFEKENLL